MNRFAKKAVLFALSGQLLWPLLAAEPSAPETNSAAALSETSGTGTNRFQPLQADRDDGRIAYVAARMLERSQFLRQRFDAGVSARFFDHYLEVYDIWRSHFLQSDIAEFAFYRTNLHVLFGGRANTAPADEVFNRFMERLEQHVCYADELLKTEKFTFDTDERVTINRKGLPYPKDLEEAKKLWRDRLRAEYLQERLARTGVHKKASRAGTQPAPAPEGRAETAPPAAPNPAEPGVAAKPRTEHEEIVDILHRRYHRTLHALSELKDEDVLGIYLTTLAHEYDPHSDYMTAAQLESFAIAMNLRLEGIGAELKSEDGYCIINHLLPGPAAKSKKLKEGDRIIAVAQSNGLPVDLVDMRLDKAVQLIRGPKGTKVTLTILPANADASARFCLDLIRDEIKLEDQQARAKVIELPDEHGGCLRLGVIDLPSFYAAMEVTGRRRGGDGPSTSADVHRLLTKLKKENVNGVILDLRRNGGGSLEEAIRLTGLFIKEGPVVQVLNYDGSIEVEADKDPSVDYDGPLIVLTSRSSASASEILAAALQDYGRAMIVGDTTTHGKGTVQTLEPVIRPFRAFLPNAPLPSRDPGAMKITVKEFFRPSGPSTQKIGVVPDIILPSILGESKEIGESTLENPLPTNAIASAKFERLNLVAPYVSELRKRSAERVAHDPEYAYIREDIELYKKLEADKTVSLNENQRLKQKAEDDARAKARQQERLARKPGPEIVHELTLKDVDLPGLPSPTNSHFAAKHIAWGTVDLSEVWDVDQPGLLLLTNATVKTSLPKALTASLASTNASLAPTNASLAADASARPATDTDDLADEDDEDKAPAFDAALAETERILVDYLSVLPKASPLTAGRPGGP